MNILWALVLKDLLRDWRRPWGALIMISIPIVLVSLLAMIFGRSGEVGKNITLHVAVWDQDNDFISGMLRSMASQGNADRQLQVHVVDRLEDGLKLLEKHQASALLVFPKHLTGDLLDGATTTIQIYKNPAESLFPVIIEQGTDLLAVGISQVLEGLRTEIKQAYDLFHSDTMPSSWTVAMGTYQYMERLRNYKTYLFPPILTFQTVAADAYIPYASATVQADTGGNRHD